jgi:hypothetical protein
VDEGITSDADDRAGVSPDTGEARRDPHRDRDLESGGSQRLVIRSSDTDEQAVLRERPTSLRRPRHEDLPPQAAVELDRAGQPAGEQDHGQLLLEALRDIFGAAEAMLSAEICSQPMSLAAPAGRYEETAKRTAMTNPKTQTLGLRGGTLTYDVREAKSETGEPVLLLIGSPMGASGFAALAGHLPDRRVVTYDPRGVGRSPRADGMTAATPDEHAEDLHRLISALDVRPVDIFPTSVSRARMTAAATTRCWGRTCSTSPATSPTSTRCAGRRRGSSSRPAPTPEGTFPYRAALAVAERLATEAVIFPSHHGGFDEQGDPDAFAATLHGVLTSVG